MKLIQFKEQTATYAEKQPEYQPLPAFQFPNDPAGRIACCWQLTWKERFRVLFTGRIWHLVLTFNQPLQPQLLQLEKPFTPEDVLAASAEKRAQESKQAFIGDLLAKYGPRAKERMAHFDALNYHHNDRRRCVRVEPDDFRRCREHGIMFIEGARIVDHEYKTAI